MLHDLSIIVMNAVSTLKYVLIIFSFFQDKVLKFVHGQVLFFSRFDL